MRIEAPHLAQRLFSLTSLSSSDSSLLHSVHLYKHVTRTSSLLHLHKHVSETSGLSFLLVLSIAIIIPTFGLLLGYFLG